MVRSSSLALCSLLLAAAALSGCSPGPEPAPTPTPAFASEEEAFAAAEDTYRAYIDALNAVDIADPATFEHVFEYSTGEFEAGDRENLSRLHADSVTMSGQNVVTGFVPVKAAPKLESLIGRVCVDVSSVAIADEFGKSVVSPDRTPTYAIDVTFVVEDARLLIQSATRSQATACV